MAKEHTEDPRNPTAAVFGGGAHRAADDGPSPSAQEIEGDLYCPKCGYNLRGLTSDRCPECGYDIRVIRQRKSQIPWVYRDQEGSFRAYWKTVWLVMFKNERFCFEISRPVDEGHARRFRLLTMLHAYLPILVVTLLWSASGLTAVTPETCTYLAVVHLGIIACIVLTTALPYYALYHPDVSPEKLHRAAVLTLYTCAPLAWMFVLALLVIAGFISGKTTHWVLDLAFYLFAGSLVIALPAVTLLEMQRLVRRMLGAGKTVRWTVTKIVVLWFLAVISTLLGIPFGAAFLALVYYSLQ